MTCGSCVLHIEKDVKKMEGVKSINVNFATEEAQIEFDCHKTSEQKIIEQIKKTGYTATLIGEPTEHESHHADHNQGSHHDHQQEESQKEIRSKLYKLIFGAIISIIILAIGLGTSFENKGFIMLILALLILLYTGKEFFTRGIPALILKGRPNMDTLVALGVSAAFLFSSYNVLFTPPPHEEYFMDAAFISTFIMLGRYLEARAKGSASEAIKKLFQLSAKEAHREENGKIVNVPIEQVKKGDILLVKPGEKTPVDGIITKGHATIDESMVTGESIPSDKKEGDTVIGATLNGTTSFTMKAENVGKDTMLSQMIEMVKNAQMSKAPIQKLVDTVSNYFVWGVMLIGLITFAGWYYAGATPQSALIHTVAVLIIACPCALGLATPISIVVGSGKGASMGILLKKTESLENIHKITTICFDKTGTITKGQPQVKTFKSIEKNDQEKNLAIALSLESQSEHPLAQSIVHYIEDQKISPKEVKSFFSETGKGVSGEIDSQKYFIGSQSYLKTLKIDLKSIENDLSKLSEQGETISILANEKHAIAYFGIRDEIKESSKEAISLLHSKNIKSVMITGDNEKVARAIAKEVSIDEFFAEVSPKEKTEKIKELKERGEIVAMVGDGINDAPALATADIGIAMGTGTDIAIESGDLVLVKGDLLKAVEAIELSKATLRNIKQNLFWAFIYNSIGIPVAAFGLLNPILSSAAMGFSSVSVVLNALRLKRFKAK